MRTIAYIDGFNLYHGVLEQASCRNLRWLNVYKFIKYMLPKNDVQHVHYFTARVSDILDGVSAARQRTYLAALETLPNVTIHYGKFKVRPTWAVPLQPIETIPSLADTNTHLPHISRIKIKKVEEKGSDVNLATQLLVDAYENKFDVAAVVTNDTDLVWPVSVVKAMRGKAVGLIPPVLNRAGVPKEQHRFPAKDLVAASTFIKRIKEVDLRRAQFSDVVAEGISKPSHWH